jgi:hypothetical protein
MPRIVGGGRGGAGTALTAGNTNVKTATRVTIEVFTDDSPNFNSV